MLKAIDTKYNKYLFRSRLEARWAVFFDNMSIKWRYEAEGYDLDGLWYLPDFWLPEFNGGMFVEVKPINLNEDELKKATLLVEKSKKPIWLAVGQPEVKAYDVFEWFENEVVSIPCIPNVSQAFQEDRMYYWPEFLDSNEIVPEDYICNGIHLLRSAVNSAYTVRF